MLCVLHVQVQQALMRADWPQELLAHQKQLDCAAAGLTLPRQLTNADSSNHSVTPRLSSFSTTPVSPLQSFVSAASTAAPGSRSSNGGNGLSFSTAFSGLGAKGSSRRSQSHTGLAAGVSLGPAGLVGAAGSRAAAPAVPRPSNASGSSTDNGGGAEQRLEGQGSCVVGVGSSLWQQGPLQSISGGVAGSSGGFGTHLAQLSLLCKMCCTRLI
jgi:hypothetical protein